MEIVRDYLARGVTGCLVGGDDRGQWRLYVMQGEILAAHGPRDGEQLVQRLLNGGSISPEQADKLQAELAQGASFEGLLLGRVPEDLFLELLVERFRQNVLDFLCATTEPDFQAMEAVFVDNIQTGHDSLELLESLAAVREQTEDLRLHADELVVRVGSRRPDRQAHARLLDLVDPERLLSSLLTMSPYEGGRTLQAVADMERAGVVELVGLGNEEAEVVGLTESAYEARQGLEPLLEPEDDTQQVGAVSSDPDEAELFDLASDLLEPISDMVEPQHLQEAEPALEPEPDLFPEPEPLLEPEVEPTAEAERDDPAVLMALKRAREIEERRATARESLERDDNGVTTRPPGFDWDEAVPEDELAFFSDQDEVRGRGEGQFTTERELLDVVDLSAEGMAAFKRAMDLPVDSMSEDGDIIAMAEATEEDARHAVALNFSGPQLDEDDVRRKIRVVNDVLAEVVRTIDEQNGRGSGRVGLQLLVDGPPTRFGVLFRGVKVDEDGRMDTARLIRNLRKRPPTEHRRLLNDGLMDLIQRCLSTSLEELDEERLDHMLERIAGYQQRLGL